MDDRFNTTAGWALFSGIVALGLATISGHYFSADKPHRPHEMGYEIEGVVEEGGGEKAVPLATLLAEADPARGKAIFAKCTSCHTIEAGGANGLGPNLHEIVGDSIATGRGGFAFSDALKSHGGKWTFENLNEWLTSPKAFAPGTKMTFAGLGKPEDRAAMIVYLNSEGSNLPLPPPPAAGAEDAAADAVAPDGPIDAGTAKDAGAMAQPAPAADGGGDTAVGSVSETQAH